MDRASFVAKSSKALEHIERKLGALEHDALDVQLSGDVLTLAFGDGARYVINSHSAAGQIWMAADLNAWHFDFVEDRGQWIAAKTGDELLATVSRVVGKRLGVDVAL
jgi:CyaY protein